MNIFKNSNRKRGFSLIEVVIVVAVIGILLAVAVPNIIAYYRELKLVELDDNARTIFMAAQNEISAILAADKGGVPDGTDGSCKYPSSVAGGKVDDRTTVKFDYLSTDNVADADSLHKIVPAGSIESELHGNNYVVEYNHETGAVHAVWYWEGDSSFTYKSDYNLEADTAKDVRIKAPVGYYGGEGVDRIKVNQMPIPELTLINAEELKLDISMSLKNTSDINSLNTKVDVTISDSEGHEQTIIEGASLVDDGTATNLKGSLVLDTLKNYTKKEITTSDSTLENIGNKFKDWVAANPDIKPGDNITVSVKLYLNGTVGTGANKRTLIPQVASVATNSLFANVTADGTAEIAYGRHLQNLHDSGTHTGSGGEYCSGVLANTAITKAKQIKDINFTLTNDDEPIKSWASTYGTLDFHPVNNPQLTEYDGDDCEIRNMNAGHYVYGGVFSYIKGGTYKNIVIVNPHIHAEGAVTDVNINPAGGPALTAGALAGAVDGTVTIENCRVYNEYDSIADKGTKAFEDDFNLDGLVVYYEDGNPYDPSKTTEDDLYVKRLQELPHIGAPASGSNSGGLVGAVLEDGTLTITNSFASVINIGAKNVGGLIGISSGNVTIEGSYSASYVFGNRNVAGLIGFVEDTTKTTAITDSYAAGEIVSGYKAGFKGAGLLHYNGEAQATSKPANIDVSNSYAAVRYGGDGVNGQPRRSDETGSTSSVLKIVGYIYGTFKLDPQNYYVQQSGIEYGLDSQGQEIAGTGGEIVDKTAYSDYWTPSACGTKTSQSELATQVSGASWSTDPGTLENTHAYKLLSVTKDLKAYPYPMLNTMAHYGDWLEDAGGDAMMAYIEKYDDGSYRIYSAKASSADGTDATIVKNGLEPNKNKIVIDDFYRIVSPTELTGWKFKLDDDDVTEYELTADSVHPTIESGGVTYYCYTLEKARGWDSKVNYYHEIKFEGHDLAFIYNPSFACEAFDVSEFVYPDGGGASADVHTETRRSKPEMDDHITIGTLIDTDVFIRSARQLANIQAYTNDTTNGSTAQGWAYDQLLDVYFDKYSGNVAGKTAAKRLDPATLKNGAYDGHGKTISNLYIGPGAATTGAAGGTEYAPAGLFGTVTGGEVRHVRLVNIDLDLSNVTCGVDSAAVGGLVGRLNGGKVDDCGIYVVADGPTTTGTIEESYKNKTIKGSGANGVGGLIGQIQSGNVSDSFAAVNVEGTAETAAVSENPVGGFVGQFGGGTITNCYAGGYVDATSKTYEDNSVNVKGKNNVGGFVGSISTSTVTFEGINYSTASVGGPNHDQVGLFAGAVATNFSVDKTNVMLNAVAKAFKAETTGSVTTYTDEAPRDESDYMGGTAQGSKPTEKVPYNQDVAIEFPFPSGQTVHHGDWINVESMGLYYDTVMDPATGDTTTGYYANGDVVNGTIDGVSMAPLATGTPGSGEIATDDGYMFVTKDNLGTISIRVGEKSFPITPVPSTTVINGKTYEWKYEVPTDALNAPAEHYYTAVSINGKIFYANFGVAGEIFDESHGGVDKPWAKSGIKYTDEYGNEATLEDVPSSGSYTGIVVRSARQLANIGIATNNGTKAGEALRGMKFEQVLDIDFGEKVAKYNADKLPSVKDKAGNEYNHVPITLNGASARYDGNGYTVRNLRPGTLVDGNFAENGMFGSVKGGATLEGITLVNARVVTDGADNGVMSVPSASTGTTPAEPSAPKILDVGEWVTNGILNTGRQSPSTSPSQDGFTITWKRTNTTDSQTNVENRTKEWVYNGSNVYSGTHTFSFGSKSSTESGKEASYIKFEATGPATVKIWWVQISSSTGTHGQVKLYKDSISDANVKGQSVVGTDNEAYLTVFSITESGTHSYYLGDNGSNGVRFYRVELYNEDVPYSESDPRPYDTTNGKYPFPEGGSGAEGVTIPNNAKVRAGALAGIVDGSTVINCGAYVEREFDSDGNEILHDGKVAYDHFIVKNAFKGSNEDYVGGLIGNVANSPNVTGSFAAVKVLGVQNAGGFAGKLGGTTTVTNCYVGGHTLNGTYYEGKDKPLKNITTSDKTNVTTTGGFAGQSDTAVTFSGVVYTTASVGMAENTNTSSKIGRFIGNGATPTKDTTNDTTLYATGIMARKDTVIGGGEEVSFKVGSDTVKVKFGQTEDYLDETVTMRGDNVGTEAGAYDDALTMDYPYLVANDKDTTGLKQKIHHGDWPVRVNFVYYELYKDDPSNNEISALPKPIDYTEHIGVYGVFETADPDKPLVVNTLITKGDVYESGYMITAPIQMEYVDFRAVSHYTKEGEGETNSWTGAQVKLEDLGLSSTPLGDNGKYCYLIPAEQLNKAPSDEYYMRAYVNGGLYLINPHFACEILNVTQVMRGTDGTYDLKLDEIRPKLGMKYYDENGVLQGDPDGVTLDGVVIRSAWNFASIARYTRPSNNGKTKDTIVNSKFYQLLDIDFTAYKDGQIYDGNENNRIINGSNEKYDVAGQNFTTGLAPAYLKNGGRYEGFGHTISNVYLMNDSGKENYYTGLFVLSGATVQNLKLDNIHSNVSRIKDDDKKVYVGILAGKVDGNSTITNVEITNGEIDLHKVPSWSKNDDKFSEPDNRADEHVVDVGGVGAVTGLLNGGTVDNVNVSGLTVNLNSGKYYYKITENAPVEQSETSGTNFKQYGTVVKKDSAISIGGAIGDIDTTGTAGAKAEVTNVYVIDPIIKANAGDKNFVGGLVGRADGKAEGVDYDASGRGKITISGSGVYLTDAVVKDGTNVTDNFNTKYGVIANDKSSFVGGFVGRTDHYVSVDNCFSAIRVEGAGSVGGFAGHIEGSVIDSCYSGGHTVNAHYETGTGAVANVKGLGANTVGGFAGKIEGAESHLELLHTIYTTSSVTNSGSGKVGLFQGGEGNKEAVAKAKTAGTVLYATGKTVGGVTAIDEKDYLVNYPGNTGRVETHAYDPEITEDYPYANSTEVSLDRDHAHYGDWEKYSANAAFYWEREGSEYHFYAVLTDSNGNTTVDDRLCDRPKDGHGIDAWGYGVFTSDDSVTLSLPAGLTVDDSDEGQKAMEAVMGPSGFGAAEKVLMIKGTTAKDSEYEVTVGRATFYINPAYAAAVSKKPTTMGTSAGDNAYQIRHVQQLQNIEDGKDTFFQQTHDVVGKDDTNYKPISLNGGGYDGGSYRILDLDIKETGSDGAALFSALENAEINHTILYGTDGEGAISGSNAAGIVASMNGGSIKNSIVAGYTITGKTVGGLAAETEGAVSIENSEATVRRKVNEAGGYIGGLVGQVVSGTTTIKSSYAGGDVVTAYGVKLGSGMTNLGGIVGGKAATGANVKYDTVYSYVAMIEGSGEGKLDFDNTKVKNASGKDTSDFKFVTFYGIGPDVDITKTDTIGFWSGGIPDLNTKDRALSTALVNLAAWKADNEAKEVYMPNAKDYVTDASALTNIVSGRPFPYGGYVKDANGDPIHYGDWPVAEKYAGLFYWEKERVTSVNEDGTEYTADEYHFYAYGAELVRGELFESDLLENICHEHHFNERATILDSGYGYFLPTASVGGDRDFTFSVMQGTTDVTANNVFGFDGESDTKVKSIKEELFKKLLLEHTTDGYEVYILNGSGSADLNKFAQVKDYMWKITAKVGTGTKAFDMRVYPTFGEAIYGDDFDMGDGNDDNMEDVEPMKIRTRLQFERLKDNVDNKSLDYIVLTHDIDFAEEDAKGYKAGVDECDFVDQTKTNYVPGQLRTQIFDGQGYRLFDVKISVNGTKKSDTRKYTSADDIKADDKGNGSWEGEIVTNYNNPEGDAALFLNNRDSGGTIFKNLVIYSPEKTGVIETSVDGGYAAGIVARVAITDTSAKKYDTIKDKSKDGKKLYDYHDQVSGKYAFDNCVVAGYTIKGSDAVGGLVGEATNDNTNSGELADIPMINCEVVADLVGTKANTYIGGLAGNWRGQIQDCYTGGSIKFEGVSAISKTYVGGLVGKAAGLTVKDDDGNSVGIDNIIKCYTYMNLNDSSIKGDGLYTLGNGADQTNCYYLGENATNVKSANKQGTEAAKLQDLVDAEKSTADVDYSYWPETKANYYGYVSDAMGMFPFRTVASCEKMSVHYGQWPESKKAAGVVYYEQYEGGGYGLQILGLDSNGAELSIPSTLCDGKHVDSNRKITEHRIVSSGYAVFTTDPVNMPVSNLTLTEKTDDGARKAIADAVNGIFPADGIKVYPTGTSGDVATDYKATVKAGGKTLNVYYTKGFAGVSKNKMGGTNTESFQIRTVRQLDNIPDSDTSGKYFKQAHDLYGEDSAGNKYKETNGGEYTGATSFAGTYDGGSYRILELSMEGTGKGIGLFNTAGGTIKNVILYSPSGDAHITNNEKTGTNRDGNGAGGIVGNTSGSSLTISNCVVAGYIISGRDMVGGIVGYGFQGADISNCAAVNKLVGTVTGETGHARGMGGIVGASDYDGPNFKLGITSCYAGGTITEADSGTYVGGIIGFDYAREKDSSNAKGYPTVNSSYSYVDLSDTDATPANVYAIGGSLVDTSSENNYYLDDGDRIPSGCNKQGTAKSYGDLTDDSKWNGMFTVTTKQGKAEKSYVPTGKEAGDKNSTDGYTPMEKQNTTASFPFPEMVQDENGKYVHYGEWPKHEPIKEAVNGIFYWEKHNGGYEVQSIGQDEAGTDVGPFSNLCTSRDGTGIEESGFGYFSYGGATASGMTNAGVAITETDTVNGITEVLKANDVYEKVEVKVFKTGTTTGNQAWSVTANGHTVTAYVNNAYATVYESNTPTEVYIRTYDQLRQMDGNQAYKQTHDIDASASDTDKYTPVTLADGKSYDGGGYRILELTITGSGSDSVGLFGTVKGTVENVVLYSQSGNATISNGRYSGGISGTLSAGKINNCVVAGYKTISGTQYVGGIAGQISDNGEITNCQAVNALEAGSNTSGGIGGIAGNVKGTIENCYAGGKITNALVSSKELKTSVGGIYGKQNSSATAENCYSYMDLTEISNDTIDKYNGKFSSIGPGSNTDCYYLASKFPTEGTAQGEKLETSTSLSGFGKADRSYAPVVPSTDDGVIGNGLTAMSDSFPYPAVFEYDGQKEHYGTWVGTTAFGDPGMPEGPGFEGAMAPAVTEAIMPEKFKLPEPENIDENGDDGHTQVVGGRMSVAKVRRVR